MLSKKINNFFLILVFILSPINILSKEIKIISKINNEIITNIDLENQIKYLLITNSNLKDLGRKELIELSKKSLIREVIKKREINKFISVSEKSNLEEKIIKQNYTSLGFNNLSDYKSFLQGKGISLELVKSKLVIEQLWNTLIYEKFKEKVKINENEIKKKIIIYKSKQKKLYEFNVSEILFDFDASLNEISSFIEKYGFESAALKFSISDTSSKGGEIGWVRLTNLSQEFQKKIYSLKIGEYTKPIKIPSGNLILKLNSKREIKDHFDLDKEIKKQIVFEQNRQLNSFSLNYYNKLKQNTIINEYK
ncbi:peptidylprolyl isomerase [Candidatus Pelagibacter sp.]|nr:peptidylprolyl isomerase [Candidatus Pelagibacter sp.]